MKTFVTSSSIEESKATEPVLSLGQREEVKYQIRITKAMMDFIKENGYNPMVDKKKIMKTALKLLPSTQEEEQVLNRFMKNKKFSMKMAKWKGETYYSYGQPAYSKENKHKTGPELTQEGINDRLRIKKATSLEVA